MFYFRKALGLNVLTFKGVLVGFSFSFPFPFFFFPSMFFVTKQYRETLKSCGAAGCMSVATHGSDLSAAFVLDL